MSKSRALFGSSAKKYRSTSGSSRSSTSGTVTTLPSEEESGAPLSVNHSYVIGTGG